MLSHPFQLVVLKQLMKQGSNDRLKQTTKKKKLGLNLRFGCSFCFFPENLADASPTGKNFIQFAQSSVKSVFFSFSFSSSL